MEWVWSDKSFEVDLDYGSPILTPVTSYQYKTEVIEQLHIQSNENILVVPWINYVKKIRPNVYIFLKANEITTLPIFLKVLDLFTFQGKPYAVTAMEESTGFDEFLYAFKLSSVLGETHIFPLSNGYPPLPFLYQINDEEGTKYQEQFSSYKLRVRCNQRLMCPTLL